MIYKRPYSVKVSENDYLSFFGSLENAKRSNYNIGAGVWSHPFWTNLDLPPQSEAFAAIQAPFIKIDLVNDKSLPIPSEMVNNFFCSHVVEHLPQIAVQNLFNETHRCLKKNGFIRITTGPCADLDWNALERKDSNWWFWMRDDDFKKNVINDLPPMTLEDMWLHHLATPHSIYSKTECNKKYSSEEIKFLVKEYKGNKTQLLDMLTSTLQFDYKYPGNHISWWNFEKLKKFLLNAGFKNIYRSAYGQSKSLFMRDLNYFDQTYPQISVYVEAIK